ncbi:MAG: response regulator [bacterium]|nr:response regulator [bacterium]
MLLTNNRSSVQTFTDAEVGLSYIISEYSHSKTNLRTILFLDLEMPLWNGWHFLDSFEQLDLAIKQQIKIYMVSSSNNIADIERASANKNIAAHFVKPLPKGLISSILNEEGRQTWPLTNT